MTYAPTNPLDLPPFHLQPLIATAFGSFLLPHRRSSSHHSLYIIDFDSQPTVRVTAAQALGTLVTPPIVVQPLKLVAGSEIYVGCSNGELLRFALQADEPMKVSVTMPFC